MPMVKKRPVEEQERCKRDHASRIRGFLDARRAPKDYRYCPVCNRGWIEPTAWKIEELLRKEEGALMDRTEHVAWCKKRAHEYLDQGDIPNAITSMLSDMSKHPECGVHDSLTMLGMLTITQHDMAGAKRFVDGFN